VIETTIESLLTPLTPSVYPVTLPKGATAPALWIAWKTVTSVGKATFSTRGLTRARIQVDCCATRYLSAATLRASVRTALDGYNDGSIGVLFLSDTDLFDDELMQYRCVVEFYVFYAA